MNKVLKELLPHSSLFASLRKSALGIMLAGVVFSGSAFAVEPAPKKPFERSVAVQYTTLLGLVTNYEQQLKPHHSLVGEVTYGLVGRPSGSWSVGMSYRYYVKPGLEGFFFGPFGRYGFIKNEFEMDDHGSGNRYRMESPLALVGMDFLGYRLQYKSGWSTVFRAGYGIQIYNDYQWSPLPEDSGDRLFRERLFGLDFELSTGFSF